MQKARASARMAGLLREKPMGRELEAALATGVAVFLGSLLRTLWRAKKERAERNRNRGASGGQSAASGNGAGAAGSK